MSSLKPVKSSIACVITHAVEHSYTQAQIIDKVNDFIGNMPKYPVWERSAAREYFNGMFDFMQQKEIIFLYNFEGKLYCTKENKGLSFPHWSEIEGDDQDVMKKLGELGGMYYKNGKPFCNRAVELAKA